MARYEDAKAGWEIFKHYDYAASLENINSTLRRQGMSPISDRTYRHYRKLQRYGYSRYVPINQLDVKTLKDPFWDKSVRERYTPIPDVSPVWVTFADSRTTVQGYAIEVSPSSVACRFIDPKAIKFFRDATPSVGRGRVVVYFPHSQKTFHALLETITFPSQERLVIARFSFLTIAAVEFMTDREPLEITPVAFRVTPTDESTAFGELARKLYWLFQTLEACGLIADVLLTETDERKRFVVPSTRLKSLTMNSPAAGVLLAAVPSAIIFAGVVAILTGDKREKSDSTRKRKHNKTRKPTKRAFTEAEQARLLRKARKTLPGVAATLVDGIPPRAIEIFEQQLIPAASQLMDETSGKVEVTKRLQARV